MKVDKLFRSRISMAEDTALTMASLPDVIEKAAWTFPFENSRIKNEAVRPINEENLVQKMLIDREGGLCYELNPLLYLFLLENGFGVRLLRGEVYNQTNKDWTHLGRTHVTIVLRHEGRDWLVDTGFGGNLPLRPVPLDGETVCSRNGEFRIISTDSDYGNYILEMNLKSKGEGWQIGYIFDTTKPVQALDELDEVQDIIKHHEKSPFNKSPLAVQLTGSGSKILTTASWKNGELDKREIDQKTFRILAREHFGLDFQN